VVWFSLAEPGTKVRDLIDNHCRHGGRAIVLDRTDRGDMIVIRHGRRSMQLAWTHLLPSTFGGTALFNVANAMAAAGAAFASGAGLHEIRQGLRTFTTSYYLSPGRMNQINVHNVDVIVDYCHNAPGMRVLGEFLERYAAMKAGQTDLGKISRIGMIATAGDRRESDMRELGAVAAEHFDVVVVREDQRLRGRELGFTAELVAEGVRSRIGEPGVRCRQVEIVLDETEAVRHVMARANPGDIVVLTVDQHAAVMSELESMTKQAQPGTHTRDSVGDPDLDPETLQEEAKEAGDSAARDLEPQPPTN
jgi:cyanophycin synthetase